MVRPKTISHPDMTDWKVLSCTFIFHEVFGERVEITCEFVLVHQLVEVKVRNDHILWIARNVDNLTGSLALLNKPVKRLIITIITLLVSNKSGWRR